MSERYDPELMKLEEVRRKAEVAQMRLEQEFSKAEQTRELVATEKMRAIATYTNLDKLEERMGRIEKYLETLSQKWITEFQGRAKLRVVELDALKKLNEYLKDWVR